MSSHLVAPAAGMTPSHGEVTGSFFAVPGGRSSVSPVPQFELASLLSPTACLPSAVTTRRASPSDTTTAVATTTDTAVSPRTSPGLPEPHLVSTSSITWKKATVAGPERKASNLERLRDMFPTFNNDGGAHAAVDVPADSDGQQVVILDEVCCFALNAGARRAAPVIRSAEALPK